MNLLIELNGNDTQILLSDEPWRRGLQRLRVKGREIPFLLPALSGHHFFTGLWPPPPETIDYEPHESPGSLQQVSATRAIWHQPETPYTHVETYIEYEIVGPGTVEARFETRSRADSYPHGYVGLFWGTGPIPGGQRGIHIVLPGGNGGLSKMPSRRCPPGYGVRWHYFQGGGDCGSGRANTILGPNMPSATHSPDHPPTYFFAEAAHRFALPIQVGRWRDLYYSLEVDSHDIAFTNVLLATAIGGPSWDIYWRLRPGETKSICCRLTVGPWRGWGAIEERYRSWHGCVDPSFEIEPIYQGTPQCFARPEPVGLDPDSGLTLSQKLFETRGRRLLETLNLLDRCSVGYFGGTSQNAGLDDRFSGDHMWGPYVPFLLPEKEWAQQHRRLKQAIQEMPDEVDGVQWIGYDGPQPRKTDVWEIGTFLRALTGFEARPQTDRQWLPHLNQVNMVVRRWTERLFDAGRGQVFHDPGNQFTELWRHWTAYVPPDIHRALLARSLFRVWNIGPEYNLKRVLARRDQVAFVSCLNRFVDEVLELAFCWNEQFVPPFKWRIAQFRRLPICPTGVRQGIERLGHPSNVETSIETAESILRSIKVLMKDLYHLQPDLRESLSTFAHAMHNTIEDAEVKRQTPLEW
jgi:hypothetical protein